MIDLSSAAVRADRHTATYYPNVVALIECLPGTVLRFLEFSLGGLSLASSVPNIC
jgi:hypothetical protein